MGNQQYGIDAGKLNEYAVQIKDVVNSGVELAIVIGGGNIFRGLSGSAKGFDRVKGDQMGMLATVINSLALNSAEDTSGSCTPNGPHSPPATLEVVCRATSRV